MHFAASAKGGGEAIFRPTITSYLRKQIPRLSSRELSKKNLHSFGSSLYTSCWKARSFFMQIRRTPSSQRGFRTPRYKVVVNFPFHAHATLRRNFGNVKNMEAPPPASAYCPLRYFLQPLSTSGSKINASL